CPVRFVRDTPAWRMAKPDRLVWHAPRLCRCLPRKRGVSAEDNAARTVRVRAHGIDSYLDLIQRHLDVHAGRAGNCCIAFATSEWGQKHGGLWVRFGGEADRAASG